MASTITPEKETNTFTSADKLEGSGNTSLTSNIDYSGVNEKSLVRKIDWRIIPGVILLYLLSFLDRSNVANAKVEGLAEDTHMTGNQYLTGLTLFFVGYILFEVPCNIILKRTSPRFWLPTLTIVWGVVTTLQGVIHNLTGFFVIRFFLGIAEGGLFPGVIFYLGFFYLRKERQLRVSFFFSAAALAGAFGGALAWGIAHMKGVAGLDGWKWIFILEGIFTVLCGLAGYWFISDYPETSTFLTEDEKNVLAKRLALDNDATPHEGFTWANVSIALKDPKVWLYCFAFHTMSLPLYTLSLFLPTIIVSLGYSSYQAQLLTVPPYALATVVTIGVAFLAARFKIRAPFAMTCSGIAIIGYIILLANNKYYIVTTHPKGVTTHTPKYNHPGISYLAVFFSAAGMYGSTALALGWPAVNVSGATKRATAGAMQITIGNLGAVIGTQLYRSNDTPTYTVGHSVALAYLCLNIIVTGTIWWYLRRENAQREAADSQVVTEGRQWEGDADPRWRFQT